MHLNKNEKKTLKLLISNSKLSDTEIARKLKLSNPAIGKIRKKLEKEIIKSYSLNLDYAKLGIQIFVMELIKVNPQGNGRKAITSFIKTLTENLNCIKICKLPEQNSFCVEYIFRNISEFDEFFSNSPYCKGKNCTEHKLNIEQQEFKILTVRNLLKDNSNDFLKKVIDEF